MRKIKAIIGAVFGVVMAVVCLSFTTKGTDIWSNALCLSGGSIGFMIGVGITTMSLVKGKLV